MRVTFASAALVLAVAAWATAAVDFLLPMASTGSLLEDTKAECARNIKRCWFLSFLKPSEPICASDQGTYSGECHLCSRVLYEGLNITKLHDGPCGAGPKARMQPVPSRSLDRERQQDWDKSSDTRKQETARTSQEEPESSRLPGPEGQAQPASAPQEAAAGAGGNRADPAPGFLLQ